MAFQIQIQDVRISTPPGKKYQQAEVVYTYNGENKTQKIMSFANPDVFKKVQGLVGKTAAVTITKNDAGYNQWADIAAADSGPAEAPKATQNKVLGSTYETPEERKVKQMLIVRQSSLGAAIAVLSPGAKTALDVDQVEQLAQRFVDFVYQNDFTPAEDLATET